MARRPRAGREVAVSSVRVGRTVCHALRHGCYARKRRRRGAGWRPSTQARWLSRLLGSRPGLATAPAPERCARAARRSARGRGRAPRGAADPRRPAGRATERDQCRRRRPPTRWARRQFGLRRRPGDLESGQPDGPLTAGRSLATNDRRPRGVARGRTAARWCSVGRGRLGVRCGGSDRLYLPAVLLAAWRGPAMAQSGSRSGVDGALPPQSSLLPAPLPEPHARCHPPLRARLDTLRHVTGQWGDFFPAWFQLADELYHRGPLVGSGRAEAVEAFQRTERLRPAFGPSLEHLTWALTAEGDSSAASAEWRTPEALGAPTDEFTVALRALLRVGFAFRFYDSTSARRVLDSALVGAGIQRFPGLAAGPRYLATFDAPIGAVVMGRLFAASPDRGLQRSGLVAAAFGLVSLGQLAARSEELTRLRDRFDVAELRLLEPELHGVLLLLGLETADPATEWSRVAETLSRDADARSTTS